MRTSCLLCSLGCGIGIKEKKIEYWEEHPVNRGSLCAKGNYIIELIFHKKRLLAPKIKKEGGFLEVSWEEAIELITSKLKEKKMGIIITGNKTNEEFALAGEIAHKLNIPIATEKVEWNMGNINEINREINGDLIILIGNVFEISPVIAKRVLDAKYENKAKIVCISSKKANTTWFANTHLQNKPKTTPLVLAGIIKKLEDGFLNEISFKEIEETTEIKEDEIRLIADTFANSKEPIIVYEVYEGDAAIPQLINKLCEIKKAHCIPLSSVGNGLGASYILPHCLEIYEINELLQKNEIDGLLIFGDCLFEIKKPNFLGVAISFPNKIMEYCDIVLPTALWCEKEGEVVCSTGMQKLNPLAPPPGNAKTELEILQLIANKLNILYSSKEPIIQKTKPIPISREILFKDVFSNNFLLILEPNPFHSKDGITQNVRYALDICPPFIEINKKDAEELRIKDKVRVRTKNGESVLNVKITNTVLSHTAYLPEGLRETTSLFPVGRNITTGSIEGENVH